MKVSKSYFLTRQQGVHKNLAWGRHCSSHGLGTRLTGNDPGMQLISRAKLSFYSSYHIPKVAEMDNNEVRTLTSVDLPVWRAHMECGTYLQCFQHGHRLQEGLVHLPLKKTNEKFVTQEEISSIPRLPQHLLFTWRVESVHTASDQCYKGQETMLDRRSSLI